jgi:hypothetical protein
MDHQRSQDISVAIATGCGLEGRRLILNRGKYFLLSAESRPAPGPTQPPIQWIPRTITLGIKIQWIPRTITLGIKRPGREADHSPPSSAEVKNGGAIPPFPSMSS